QLRLEHLVGVEDVVIDLDARFLLEVRDHGLVDVVRPVINVENLLAGCALGGRRPAATGDQPEKKHTERRKRYCRLADHRTDTRQGLIRLTRSAAGAHAPTS